MSARQLIVISLCAWWMGAGAARADEAAAAASSRRPLPHPDILQVPPESNAAAEGSDASALKTAGGPTGAEAPAVPSPAAGPGIAAPTGEDREILRRGGQGGGSAGRGLAGEARGPFGGGGFSLLTGLWPLAAVLALIAGLAFVLRKFLPARKLLVGSDVLRVVARTHLSPKQQLVLVKLGHRLVMLGVSPERVNALMTLDDPEQVAQVMGEIAGRRPGSMSNAFAASMAEQSGRYGGEDAGLGDPEAVRGEVQGLLQKVRRLAGKGVGV
ncbi:MAG: FliO/MopB family protein [Planctomycetes bacterium]|nr:FliO/MopB family protein [Planctomycetota bacterium]